LLHQLLLLVKNDFWHFWIEKWRLNRCRSSAFVFLKFNRIVFLKSILWTFYGQLLRWHSFTEKLRVKGWWNWHLFEAAWSLRAPRPVAFLAHLLATLALDPTSTTFVSTMQGCQLKIIFSDIWHFKGQMTTKRQWAFLLEYETKLFKLEIIECQ